jgi:fluoroacetyl-CoA thioesterase
MKPQSIPLGSKAEVVQVVTQDDLASILGEVDDIFPKVFATSKMVALMEIAASRVLKKFLLNSECSVGIEVNINHVSPTSIGAKVRAQAILIEIVDHIFTFTVKAFDESGLIGEGTHKRSIVDIERLEKGALSKISLFHYSSIDRVIF